MNNKTLNILCYLRLKENNLIKNLEKYGVKQDNSNELAYSTQKPLLKKHWLKLKRKLDKKLRKIMESNKNIPMS